VEIAPYMQGLLMVIVAVVAGIAVTRVIRLLQAGRSGGGRGRRVGRGSGRKFAARRARRGLDLPAPVTPALVEGTIDPAVYEEVRARPSCGPEVAVTALRLRAAPPRDAFGPVPRDLPLAWVQVACDAPEVQRWELRPEGRGEPLLGQAEIHWVGDLSPREGVTVGWCAGAHIVAWWPKRRLGRRDQPIVLTLEPSDLEARATWRTRRSGGVDLDAITVADRRYDVDPTTVARPLRRGDEVALTRTGLGFRVGPGVRDEDVGPLVLLTHFATMRYSAI